MAKILLSIMLLSLSASTTVADQSTVLPFKYSFSIRERSGWTRHYGISVEYKLLDFRGESLDRVPGRAASHKVYLSVSNSAGRIVAIAIEEASWIGKPVYPPDRPAKSFHFNIKSLQLSPEGLAKLELRFKDTSEIYNLRYIEGQGLQLEAVDTRFGSIIAASAPEFVTLNTTQGRYAWQCNPLTISATKDGKPLWSNDIPMQGQPEFLSVLDSFVFVRTTSGHSFYVLKDSGELVFYDRSVMVGDSPSDDILRIWQKEMRLAPYDLTRRKYFRFIRAAVMLNEKRAIPLLIECIEKGRGLDERCAAIAALEKFNGNPDLWSSDYPLAPSFYLKQIGMDRVFPKDARQAEREKWEKVFKDDLEK